MIRVYRLLTVLLVVLTGCGSTNKDGKCLSNLLHSGDLAAAETFLLRNPAHINGEYLDDDDVDLFANNPIGLAKCSFTKGQPLLSVFAGKAEIIKWLIDHGARIDLQRTARRGSPLHAAATCSLPSTVLMVEDAKKKGPIHVILESEDGARKTALYYAIEAKNYPVAEYLMKNGTHINHVNSANETILDQVVGEILLIGNGDDFGGQERVAELKKAEAWIRQHGGKFHIEIARRWVKERNEHDDLLRKHYKKSMTPEEIEDFLKNKP